MAGGLCGYQHTLREQMFDPSGVSWNDVSGNLWLFGGVGYGSTGMV